MFCTDTATALSGEQQRLCHCFKINKGLWTQEKNQQLLRNTLSAAVSRAALSHHSKSKKLCPISVRAVKSNSGFWHCFAGQREPLEFELLPVWVSSAPGGHLPFQTKALRCF